MELSPSCAHADVRVVRADEIDNLAHVSNIVYLRWILDAAVQHSLARGFGHEDYRRLGSVFVVRRHEIDYLSSARLGDEVVVRTWVDSWKAASCVRRTEIESSAGEPFARASTRWAFVSLETGRPQRIPEEVRRAFS